MISHPACMSCAAEYITVRIIDNMPVQRWLKDCKTGTADLQWLMPNNTVFVGVCDRHTDRHCFWYACSVRRKAGPGPGGLGAAVLAMAVVAWLAPSCYLGSRHPHP